MSSGHSQVRNTDASRLFALVDRDQLRRRPSPRQQPKSRRLAIDNRQAVQRAAGAHPVAVGVGQPSTARNWTGHRRASATDECRSAAVARPSVRRRNSSNWRSGMPRSRHRPAAMRAGARAGRCQRGSKHRCMPVSNFSHTRTAPRRIGFSIASWLRGDHRVHLQRAHCSGRRARRCRSTRCGCAAGLAQALGVRERGHAEASAWASRGAPLRPWP